MNSWSRHSGGVVRTHNSEQLVQAFRTHDREQLGPAFSTLMLMYDSYDSDAILNAYKEFPMKIISSHFLDFSCFKSRRTLSISHHADINLGR